MNFPNFGHNNPVRVSFTYANQKHQGALSEVHGSTYWWYLHSGSFIAGVLHFENGRLWFGDPELDSQIDYFAGVLVGWYQ